MTQKAFWMCSFPNMDLFPKFDIISKTQLKEAYWTVHNSGLIEKFSLLDIGFDLPYISKHFGPKENIVPQNLGSHINTVKASEPL